MIKKAKIANSMGHVIGISWESDSDNTVIDADIFKQLQSCKEFLVKIENKLMNENFLKNAKPEIVEKERQKKIDVERKIKMLETV